MRGRLWPLVTATALVALAAGGAGAQQPTRVTGLVVDAGTSRPMVGVQVVVKGTTVGTLTNSAGRYLLTVPSGRDSLTFTSLGYRTLTAAVAPTVNVQMQVEAVALQGVVVTALGIEREQRSISYSAQTVSTDRLNVVPQTNVVSALEGDVAGVHITSSTTPGGSARIVLRGESSITGNNQPLFVVDGVPIDNSAGSNGGYANGTYGGYDLGNGAADLNTEDIQSITVLKGPNAAALYGSRAANGAIVITTKSGRGQGDRGWGISATIGSQFARPLRLPPYQNQYGQGFYGEFDFVDGNGGGVNDEADESWGPKLDGRTSGCVYAAGQAPAPVPPAKGVYDTTKPCHQFFGVGPWIAHPDNVASFYNTGVAGDVTVAVARSNQTSNLRMSVARHDETGMYPNSRLIKTNVGLNGGSQISEKLSTETSVEYIRDDNRDLPAQAYEEIDPQQGFIWFNRATDMRLLKQNLFRTATDPMTGQIISGNPTLRTDAPIPYSWNYSYHPNPYWMAYVKQDNSSRDRILGHGSVTYKFTDWFSLTGRVGRDWYQNHFRVNYPVNDISPYNGGGLWDVGEVRSETNADFLATVNRKLLPDLTMTVNAGGNSRVNDYNNNTDVVSQLVIPGVYTLSNSAGQPSTSIFVSKKHVNALYGSANLSYKSWLSLDVTGRNDWSSTLPAGANSFFYPSVGGAFIFTDALGIHSNVLSYGKLRASWTRVGNDTDPYQLQAVYSSFTPWGGQPSFTAPDVLFNSKLKPEQTTGMEAGTDLGLFDSRLVLNATIYQKSTVNQIFPVSISPTTGYTQRYVNAGEVRNRGLELEANITPIQTASGFRWNVIANWSKNNSRVMSLFGGVSRFVIGNYWGVNVTADTGQPYGNLVGVKWARDKAGHIIVDANGIPIRDNTQVVLGNYNPEWNGGITNTFSYKSVSLSLLFDGQMGGQVYSVTKWFGQYSGVLSNTLVGRQNDWCDPGILVPNSVHKDGSPNTTRVCPIDYWHNSFYANEDGILDASYVKLRDARLAFNLPSRLVSRMGFSAATLAVVGHDLFLWSKTNVIDPETAFDVGNRQGVENGQLPPARSIGFTLSVRP